MEIERLISWNLDFFVLLELARSTGPLEFFNSLSTNVSYFEILS